MLTQRLNIFNLCVSIKLYVIGYNVTKYMNNFDLMMLLLTRDMWHGVYG